MTTTIKRTAKATKSYTPAALFRVYDKKTGALLGYAAPSRDGAMTYFVTCDELGCWHCTCDGNTEWHRECCHIKAAKELCAIRVEQGRPGCKPGERQRAVSAKPAVEIAVPRAASPSIAHPAQPKPCSVTIEARMERAPLNGNRGFSILKV